jgi:hypothetical protein
MDLLNIWAKRSQTTPDLHHPLLFHMLDVALVAQVLWRHALGSSFKLQLQEQLGLGPDESALLLSFWAAEFLPAAFRVSRHTAAFKPNFVSRLAMMGLSPLKYSLTGNTDTQLSSC